MLSPTLLAAARRACCRWMRLAAVAASAGLLAASPVRAQLGLPGLGAAAGALPGALGTARERIGPIGSTVAGSAIERGLSLRGASPLVELRRRNIDTLLAQHPDRLEVDPSGEPVVRAELVLVSPAAELLAAARAQGYGLLREEVLDPLDLRSVVLQAPPGLGTAEALARLRRLHFRVEADFNHVYLRGGQLGAGAASSLSSAGETSVRQNATGPNADQPRIGLVDSGVDLSHPALRGSAHRLWGCGGRAIASPHGTAVSSLLVGQAGSYRGVQPGATLYAADVYCGASPTGGSAEAVAQALAWMAREQVGVVNVSLVGAPNRLLERAVQALHARGHLVVAAVGNDGPAAPPLYPAAYPGVVGVTGTTPRRTVLPEAAQGIQVAFAAPGAELAVARSLEGDYVAARGTSFAAPIVAGMLAGLLPMPDTERARKALQQLAARAADLGRPGRDFVYGHGLVEPAERLQFARN